MKTIAINCWFFKHPTSGTGRYLKNLVENILKNDTQNNYLLFCPPDSLIFNSTNSKHVVLDYGEINDSREKWTEYFHKHDAHKYKFDIMHYPSVPTAVLKGSQKNIFTIHDIIPLVPFSKLIIKNFRYLKMVSLKHMLDFLKLRSCFENDCIITVSDNNRKDLYSILKLTNKNIFVIPNAVSDQFTNITNKKILSDTSIKYNLPDNFILYFGGLMIRKNVENVIKSYAQLAVKLQEKYKLVIFGNGFQEIKLKKLTRKLHLEQDVLFRPYADEEDIAAIYSLANLFVYISWYEGFGLPPLEAMACKTPVITSSVSSIPGVVGKGAFCVDPFHLDEIKAAMEIMLTKKEIAEKFVQNGLKQLKLFSWKKNALKTISIYNTL